MQYENKTIEELIDLLEAKDEEINELEESEQNIEELSDEVSELQNQIDDFNSSMGDREQVSEKAFNAGYDACRVGGAQLKSWLNYKIEERL